MVVSLHLGDFIRLKKAHPCGSYIWQVYRVGADIGLRCSECERRIFLSHTLVERRMLQKIPKPVEKPPLESVDTPHGHA